MAIMEIYRLLSPSVIDLHFEKRFDEHAEIVFGELPDEEITENDKLTGIRRVIEECILLLADNEKIKNTKRMTRRFFNREKKATTAIGHHIAIPHIRTMNVNDFMLAFARSMKGIEFNHPEGDKVNFFFIMIGPKEDESTYWNLYEKLAEAAQIPGYFDKFYEVDEPGEVIRLAKHM